MVEYLMLGATTVQLATAVMWQGWGVLGKLVRGLEDFMERHSYETLDDFRGITLQHITTVEELAKRPRKVAVLNTDDCTSCGRCVQSCFYDALSLEEVLCINPERCDGCGLCVLVCPTQALRLESEHERSGEC